MENLISRISLFPIWIISPFGYLQCNILWMPSSLSTDNGVAWDDKTWHILVTLIRQTDKSQVAGLPFGKKKLRIENCSFNAENCVHFQTSKIYWISPLWVSCWEHDAGNANVMGSITYGITFHWAQTGWIKVVSMSFKKQNIQCDDESTWKRDCIYKKELM